MILESPMGIRKPLAFKRPGCDAGVMRDAKPGSHTVWECKYHVVWITKYRFPVLGGDATSGNVTDEVWKKYIHRGPDT